MSGRRLFVQKRKNSQNFFNVGKLLLRLFGQKSGCPQMRRVVKPMPALDTRNFAVQKLVKNPSQSFAIFLDFGFKTSRSEIEFELFF